MINNDGTRVDFFFEWPQCEDNIFLAINNELIFGCKLAIFYFVAGIRLLKLYIQTRSSNFGYFFLISIRLRPISLTSPCLRSHVTYWASKSTTLLDPSCNSDPFRKTETSHCSFWCEKDSLCFIFNSLKETREQCGCLTDGYFSFKISQEIVYFEWVIQ